MLFGISLAAFTNTVRNLVRVHFSIVQHQGLVPVHQDRGNVAHGAMKIFLPTW